MKALTLNQPWATFVALGIKKIEPMDWAPFRDWRGPLAIHAGEAPRWITMLRRNRRELGDALERLTAEAIGKSPWGQTFDETFPRGVVLCRVELYSVRSVSVLLADDAVDGQEQALAKPWPPQRGLFG